MCSSGIFAGCRIARGQEAFEPAGAVFDQPTGKCAELWRV